MSDELAATGALRRMDGHVHYVGDGSAGSGCWLRLTTLKQRVQAKILLNASGVGQDALKRGLDTLYEDHLLGLLETSSLDALLVLAQDVPYDDAGKAMPEKGAFYVPNEVVLEMAARHPGKIEAAVSIHPGRPDALEELERCLAAGARVLKLLPNCLNVDCSRREYTPFWERMAEAGMLFLAHTGGELSLPVLEPAYADPRILVHPLECGVRAIAAHGAGRSALWDPDYTDTLLEMLKKYPGLYLDNSALCSINRARTLKKILHPEVLPRVIHGSDFPIPVSGNGPWLFGHVDWKTMRRAHREPNVIERDVILKMAMWFPEDSFTRLDGLLREREACAE